MAGRGGGVYNVRGEVMFYPSKMKGWAEKVSAMLKGMAQKVSKDGGGGALS